LVEDLIAIVTSFDDKFYDMRSCRGGKLVERFIKFPEVGKNG